MKIQFAIKLKMNGASNQPGFLVRMVYNKIITKS